MKKRFSKSRIFSLVVFVIFISIVVYASIETGTAMHQMTIPSDNEVGVNIEIGPVSGYSPIYGRELGSFVDIGGLEVIGDEVFTLEEETITVFNVSDPQNPTFVGNQTFADDDGGDLQIQGDLAYVLYPYDRFYCCNISDRTNITKTDYIFASEKIQQFTISENFAYLAVVGIGIMIVDISDPYNLTTIHTFGLSNLYCYDLLWYDDYLYFGDETNGFVICDVSDPYSPTIVDSEDFIAKCIYIEDDYAYICTMNSLMVYDISTPNSPVYIATKLSGALSIESPYEIIIYDDILYYVDYQRGVYLIDNNEITSTEVLFFVDIKSLYNVRKNDQFLFVIGYRKFHILAPDSDTDFLPDMLESLYGTDPNNPDCDKDLLFDGLEIENGCDPFNKDTDQDGFRDGAEVHRYRTDPTDATDKPTFFDILFESGLISLFASALVYGSIIVIGIFFVIIYRLSKKRKREQETAEKLVDEEQKKKRTYFLQINTSLTFFILLGINTFTPCLFGDSYGRQDVYMFFFNFFHEESSLSIDVKDSITGTISSISPEFLFISVLILLSFGCFLIGSIFDTANQGKKEKAKDSIEVDFSRSRVIIPKALFILSGVTGLIGSILFIVFVQSLNGFIAYSLYPFGTTILSYNPAFFIGFLIYPLLIFIGINYLKQYKDSEWKVINDPPSEISYEAFVEGERSKDSEFVMDATSTIDDEEIVEKDFDKFDLTKLVDSNKEVEELVIPRTVVTKIPDSMFKVESRRMFLTFGGILLFALTLEGVGFGLFFSGMDAFIDDRGIAGFIIGIVLMGLGMLIFLAFIIRQNLFVAVSMDMRNVRTYHSSRMTPEAIKIIQGEDELPFPTGTFLNYGFWRFRRAMGILFDNPSKETIMVLWILYESNIDTRIRKKAAVYLDTLAYKYHLATREELRSSLDKIHYDSEKQVDDLTVTSMNQYPLFDSLMQTKQKVALVFIVIIMPPFGIPFALWYLNLRKKIRHLMDTGDLEALREMAKNKPESAKAQASVTALGDVGTKEDIILLKYIQQIAVYPQIKGYAAQAITHIKRRYNIEKD